MKTSSASASMCPWRPADGVRVGAGLGSALVVLVQVPGYSVEGNGGMTGTGGADGSVLEMAEGASAVGAFAFRQKGQ